MIITLADPSTLRLTQLGGAYDALAALPGAHYDKETKSLLVSLCYLRRLLEGYPGATVIDRPGLVAARLDMWRRWMIQHNHAGIWFALDHDCKTVVATGEGVSPLFAEYVRKRSQILRQFLGDQVWPSARPLPAGAPQGAAHEPTDDDRRLLGALQGGHKAEVKRAAVSRRRAPLAGWQRRELIAEQP